MGTRSVLRGLNWLPVLVSILCFTPDFTAESELLAQQNSPRESFKRDATALPLPPRGKAVEGTAASRPKTAATGNGLWTSVIALSVIVGGLVLVGRYAKPYIAASRTLPLDAFELLGRRQIEPQVAIHFVRCGSRVLVLGVSPQGANTLSEVSDPEEVARLTEACRESNVARPLPLLSRRAKAASLLWLTGVSFFIMTGMTTAQMPTGPSKRSSATAPDRTGADRPDPRRSTPRERLPVVQPVQAEEPFPEDRGANEPARPAKDDPEPRLLQDTAFSGNVAMSVKGLILMTVIGLVPSLLLMTTCFVRFAVVFSLLRQAIGVQQAPPNQVVTALSMFLTLLVMAPVWQRCYDEGLRPYTQPEAGQKQLDDVTAFQRTAAPLREFMARQIDRCGNADAVWMLLDYQRPEPGTTAALRWHEPQSYDEVPLTVLAPAYLLSELKVAFAIGFQLVLPFLVIDLIVAAVLGSLGLMMLPPSLVSVPFKLLLFVLIDGWFLTVGMLLESVRIVS